MAAPRTLPPGLTLVDSHCHLADPRFDADREAVWERALRAGADGVVVIGAGGGSASNPAAIATACTHAGAMRAVVGIHPHDASEATAAALAELEGQLHSPIVSAVGETGLDYYYTHSP